MTSQAYHSLSSISQQQPTMHGKGAIPQRLAVQTHHSHHHSSSPFPDTPQTPPPAFTEEYPQPYEPPAANIYSAVYSGVPVYEMMSRGVAVMKRRADSFLNATQILKVAGLEKGKRTKILEREILQGEHEKVQGGYGKYQGTWVPLERGRELAEQYGVDHYLRPLFIYDTNAGGNRSDKTPTKEQAMAAQRKEAAAARAAGTAGSPASGHSQPQRKRQKLNISPPLQAQNAQFVPAIPSPGFSNPPPPAPSSTTTQSYIPAPPEPSGAEKHRSVLMAIFLNEDPNHVPELLSNPNPPADLDIDLVIDDQGHTALHWAAALARINILNHLIDKGADITRVNYMGESALDRAVLVTNNYDIQSFPELLHLLHTSIKVTDKKCRSVLHHIALTAGIKGRAPAARYYMECLLEWIARNDGDFKNIIDIQDKNGDTALNIAARVGNKSLIDQLVEVGASRLIENKVGLKPEDFGVEERGSSSGLTTDMQQESTEENSGSGMNVDESGFGKSDVTAENEKVVVPSKRGRELIEAVEQIVNDVECDYEAELSKKKEELLKSQQDLRTTTRELATLRRQITSLRTKHDHLAEANQRVVNLEQALNEETALAQSLASAGGETNIPRSDAPLTNEDADTIMEVPETATDQALDSEIRALQSRINAYTRNDADLRSQIMKLQNHAAERELQCKRLIATCCNVPLDRVDGLLDPLMQAVDADGSDIDLARVAGFMSRVKQQEGWEMHTRG